MAFSLKTDKWSSRADNDSIFGGPENDFLWDQVGDDLDDGTQTDVCVGGAETNNNVCDFSSQ